MATRPEASNDQAESKSAAEAGTPQPPRTSRVGQKKRDIKGGLPYATAPGTLKKALDGIITAERPDKFSADFMTTILKILGGSQRPVPQMLRKMGFISSDSTPTDLYSKFKSDSARGQAALDGLRNAYSEVFKRNDFAHRATESEVRDIVVEITGLQKNDQIVRMIVQTFEIIRAYVDKTALPSADAVTVKAPEELATFTAPSRDHAPALGLSYHINVVLPETENIAVFNAIFRSMRENLL